MPLDAAACGVRRLRGPFTRPDVVHPRAGAEAMGTSLDAPYQ
jgi:hypothetical protein